jgi:hypothetical protein
MTMSFLSNLLSRLFFRSTFKNVDALLEDLRAGKPIAETQPDPKSGVLKIEDSTLIYASPNYGNWQIPINQIISFGEYTTNNGPYIDDWFMVFVTRDLNWVEASNYCAGGQDTRTALALHWAAENLQGKLWGHTDFASRVIWPIALADQPLFDFVERPQSAWKKVQSFGMGLVDKNLTTQVREYLQSNVSA